MMESEWTERAGAKINLGLKILGKRSDGYHDILSVVQGIDLADTLHFRPAQHSSMTCTDPEIPCNGDNLAAGDGLIFTARPRSLSAASSASQKSAFPQGLAWWWQRRCGRHAARAQRITR